MCTASDEKYGATDRLSAAETRTHNVTPDLIYYMCIRTFWRNAGIIPRAVILIIIIYTRRVYDRMRIYMHL